MSVTTYLCMSGQAVSASSHLRRTWSREGGHYSPGSVGSASIEGHAAGGYLTRAWTLRPACCLPADPSSQPDPSRPHWGSESPTGGNDLVIGGRLGVCFLPDWKRRAEGETSPSLYMMSVNATHFLSITFSVVSSSWFPGDMLYVCGQAVCDSCVSCTSWTRQRVQTKTP